MEHLKLGASLYVPATRADVTSIANRDKLAHARSVIFCTEDSVRADDVPNALRNLQQTLNVLAPQDDRMLFVRPRNPRVLLDLLRMQNIDRIDGFVLPKLTAANLGDYLAQFETAGVAVRDFKLMPTLETAEAFDSSAMRALRDQLTAPAVRASVLSLRIGGNDLLNLLGIRRSRHRTIYESPLGTTISRLVTLFKPSGFNLTSPVCEFLHDHEILERELACDAEYGLFGKTAIHPDQVHIIEASYRPSEQEVDMAEAILRPNAPAVFSMHGTMCEVATHDVWARQVLARSEVYGIYGKTRRTQLAA